MDLTWAVAASLLVVGTGYAFVRTAHRLRVVRWGLLCASLFALATRDLFRPYEPNRPTVTADDLTRNRSDPESSNTRTDDTDSDDDRARNALFVRLLRRIASWLG